ncbi:MAG: hypothetical protein KF851_14175 [Pirellulaceae bacterium]|nr:hypothetical protein [Pirellulaceae bacterium]
MKSEVFRDTAKLIGYNQSDDIVYSVRLPLHEYYDGEHPWNTSEGVLALKMVKMTGQLFDARGNMTQEFESVFSSDDGTYIGGWAKHDDGTERRDGVCAT